MSRTTLEIHDQAVQAALKRLQERTRNLQPILAAIGSDLKARIQEGFDTSTAPDGSAWEKPKHRAGKPLLDTGRLRNSIQAKADAQSVTVGTNVIYAAIQQFGGTIKPKDKKALSFMVGNRRITVSEVTIPPRPFMPVDELPESWRDDVLATIAKGLAAAAAAST